MPQDIFEYKYGKFIEPLYGKKRSEMQDIELLKSNVIPHNYSIHKSERIDLTHLDTYTIDPEGCSDADDAFSVYNDDGKIYLAIHIADPTEYINIQSELWNDIQKIGVTRYPSNRKPIHMLPEKIVQKSSLMDNDYGNIKLAISLIFEIDDNTFLPHNEINLYFTKVSVKSINNFTYLQASNKLDHINALKYGIKISEALQKKRSEKTIGVKLNELNNSIIYYSGFVPYLYINTQNEKKVKEMIAEFAILANTYIGAYFKYHFNNVGIFRVCDANSLMTIDNNKIDGNQLIHEIVLNGIQANYLHEGSSHDLVGAEEYTHFTSPIRRVSDCICHYLLKFIYLKKRNSTLELPFTMNNLQLLSEHCLNITKQMKKIQYKDNKFRLIQIMNNIIKSNFETIFLEYYITSYKEPFLNLIINKINNHYIYISYTLKVNNIHYIHDPHKIYSLTINHVNCPGKYDAGSIPELDDSVTKIFKQQKIQ